MPIQSDVVDVGVSVLSELTTGCSDSKAGDSDDAYENMNPVESGECVIDGSE